jgi:hypothetical protein
MQVRQVVTGHDAKGRAVIARDEQIDATPIPGLGGLAFLWGADEPATYPNAGNNPAAPGPFPPVGGIRFVMATYSPEYGVVAPEPVTGMHVEDSDEPGMHRTDTTDFGVLLSGNLVLEVDWRGGVAVSRRCRGAERNTPPLARGWGRAGHHGCLLHRSPPSLRSALPVSADCHDTRAPLSLQAPKPR